MPLSFIAFVRDDFPVSFNTHVRVIHHEPEAVTTRVCGGFLQHIPKFKVSLLKSDVRAWSWDSSNEKQGLILSPPACSAVVIRILDKLTIAKQGLCPCPACRDVLCPCAMPSTQQVHYTQHTEVSQAEHMEVHYVHASCPAHSRCTVNALAFVSQASRLCIHFVGDEFPRQPQPRSATRVSLRPL